jgi:ribosome biogenesis GTPase
MKKRYETREEKTRGHGKREYETREHDTREHDTREENFICKSCGTVNTPDGAGTRHRNHCKNCLSSVHLDDEPGDRASECRGVMEAIGVWVKNNGEWSLIHRCRVCGELESNRIAADDNPVLLMSIAVRPLAMPPFPLGLLADELKSGK